MREQHKASIAAENAEAEAEIQKHINEKAAAEESIARIQAQMTERAEEGEFWATGVDGGRINPHAATNTRSDRCEGRFPFAGGACSRSAPGSRCATSSRLQNEDDEEQPPASLFKGSRIIIDLCKNEEIGAIDISQFQAYAEACDCCSCRKTPKAAQSMSQFFIVSHTAC